MSNIIMLIPIGLKNEFTSVSLSVLNSIYKDNLSLKFFEPIIYKNIKKNYFDITTYLTKNKSKIVTLEPFSIKYAENLLISNKKNLLIEKIISRCYENKKKSDLVIVKGLSFKNQYEYINEINYCIAKEFNANIIFIISLYDEYFIKYKNKIKYELKKFIKNKILSIILNKNILKKNNILNINFNCFENKKSYFKKKIIFNYKKFFKKYLSTNFNEIPFNNKKIYPKSIDIIKYLNAKIINKGDIKNRIAKSIIIYNKNIFFNKNKFFKNAILIDMYDTLKTLVFSSLYEINNIKISAIVLTKNFKLNKNIHKICNKAIILGLPIFYINKSFFEIIKDLKKFYISLKLYNYYNINYMSSYINLSKNIKLLINKKKTKINKLSPLTFCYYLTSISKKLNKKILLPEGEDIRIIKAASICMDNNIAKCILMGNPKNIFNIALENKIKLPKNIDIINPIEIQKNYVSQLFEIRKHKGMTKNIASEQIKNNIVLSTLILKNNLVDGLVSGISNSTADTIRPPLQIIKTSHGNSIISSIFFMLLPNKVLIYGDCAINSNPNANQLAEIAIQSSISAKKFGIDPKIAMISYSTKNSGFGKEVDKVREATLIVKKNRPDLIIDGPLQYDAAISKRIAKLKAPNSPVAGNATIFVFPDLNTGNTTYKAVQRTSKIISIGPILQGIKKPVNDLSRGASIDDIVYTIAITAIQSKK